METIGINLLWLQPGVVGGSEEYTLSLLRAVHELDPLDLELRIFAQPHLLDHHPDLSKRFEVTTAPRLPAGKVGRVAGEHTWLARQSARLSMVHHAGGVIPSGSPAPAMLTILDLQPLDMPKNFGRVKRNWLGQMIPRSVRQAAAVVVPSEFTGNRVVEILEADPQRVHVVPFGLSQPPALDPPSASLGSPMFLYPAIAYSHKRHCDLLDAFEILRVEHPEVELMLTGGDGPLTGELRHRIESAGLSGVVHMPGRIDRATLEDLYRRATAVVIPSEYEGFGLPALEAMNHGTPVVVADAGSLPEVVGNAGLVVPPRDPVALAAAMASLLTGQDRRMELGERGLRRAQAFRWKSAGEALINAYRDALDHTLAA